MAEQTGVDLNSLFAELEEWESQLQHLDKSVFDDVGGSEL